METRSRVNQEPVHALLTVREAAAVLSVGLSTLRRWLRLRRLAHVRCGRAVRIEAGELRRFIVKNRQPGENEPNAALTSGAQPQER